MEKSDLLFLLQGILFVFGYLPMTVEILRGRETPPRWGWGALLLSDSVLLLSLLEAGQAPWQVVAATLGAALIFTFALTRGQKGGATLVDHLCIAGVVAAGYYLYGLRQPEMAVLLSNGIVALGSIPLMRAAWRSPQFFSPLPWGVWMLSCILNLWALGVDPNPLPGWERWLTPILFAVVNSYMFLRASFGKRQE